jgi:transcriptional regulator with XRE-family HTH domain
MRALRESLGKRQKEIAAALGIRASYLSDLESGRRRWNEKLREAYKQAAIS